MSDKYKRKAVIFGVTGQDGSYLSELLLDKGYQVTGVVRRSSTPNTQRVDHLVGKGDFVLVPGDVTDAASVFRLLDFHDPHEVYNLAAQSHVKVSFDEPLHTTNVVYGGCLNILEWLRAWHQRQAGERMGPRFYQASSSEMFGSSCSYLWADDYEKRRVDNNMTADLAKWAATHQVNVFQDEDTPFLPNSPYAIAKLAAHNAVRVYRESYGVFACSGILFNHESERRPETFVTRKITKAVARAWRNKGEVLKLGNLDARRDWGHARDYVRAMWLMLQHDAASDYVVATGKEHSVKDFLDLAVKLGGVQDRLKVEVDQGLFRPCEVPFLRGDASKARKVLGWEPEISFEKLVETMVEYDRANP